MNETKTKQFDRKPMGVALTIGLAIVRKSVYPPFNKWAVIYPASKTRWFNSEEAAQKVADQFNGKSPAKR